MKKMAALLLVLNGVSSFAGELCPNQIKVFESSYTHQGKTVLKHEAFQARFNWDSIDGSMAATMSLIPQSSEVAAELKKISKSKMTHACLEGYTAQSNMMYVTGIKP